jgi:hypothetical protein
MAMRMGSAMAIQAQPRSGTPTSERPRRLQLVPAAPPARGRLVHVEPTDDGAFTCHCICGWSGRKLHFRTEAAAEHAGDLHVRVCPLMH